MAVDLMTDWHPSLHILHIFKKHCHSCLTSCSISGTRLSLFKMHQLIVASMKHEDPLHGQLVSCKRFPG